ncbi:LRR domain containing protein [Parasponia andersonii]|uniref:LRR domain containing protein n=1 Tax=Parasponia andersonii TaxID=3476 RepID=A0A2P5DXU8_PARAD|nr:LRR domain containing protein [Parasponia andersonii]
MSFKDIGENTRLRTFLVFPDFGNRYSSGFASLCLIGLRSLRIPIVRGLDFATLIHLRYLEISHDYHLIELPETLCDLCNLQTLKINQCPSLKRLPKGIGKLVKLRNLYIYHCDLEGLPKGIGKLTSLERLDKLLIPENNEAYFHFGDSKKGNHYQLRGSLRIDGCKNFRNVGEAEKASLIKMKDLEELVLKFGEIERNAEPQHEFSILEALQPHPDLKSLSIILFAGTELYASWMASFNNLRFLSLCNCLNCEILPPLGKFPYIESLVIGYMKRLEKVGAEFWGIPERDDDKEEYDSFFSFPKLKKLWFNNLPLFKEWEGSTTDFQSDSTTLKVMPCLRELILSGCGSLEAVPDFLQRTPLQHLEIYSCKILERRFQNGKGKERLHFSHIPNIQIARKYVQRDGIWIQ